MITSQNLLSRFNLLKTSPRIQILDCFLSANRPITDGELKSTISDEINRTTRYRTLNTLLQKGIIHRIVTDSKEQKYALSVSDKGGVHEHCHFQCVKCGEVECMNNQLIPELFLPDGYIVQDRNLIYTGLCPKCNMRQ